MKTLCVQNLMETSSSLEPLAPTLPNEVFDMMFALCDVNSLRSCMSVSKLFSSLVQGRLFQYAAVPCDALHINPARFLRCLKSSLFLSHNIQCLTLSRPHRASESHVFALDRVDIDVEILRSILPLVPQLKELRLKEIAVGFESASPLTTAHFRIGKLYIADQESSFPKDILPLLASFESIDDLTLAVRVTRYVDNEHLYPLIPPPLRPIAKLVEPHQLSVQILRLELSVIPLFRPTCLALTNLQSLTITTNSQFWMGLPKALDWIGNFLTDIGAQLKALDLDIDNIMSEFLDSKAPIEGQPGN